ncbi:hypothetical protein HC928_21305 [bacterium]|nr:hypothetical protein [bacterium]
MKVATIAPTAIARITAGSSDARPQPYADEYTCSHNGPHAHHDRAEHAEFALESLCHVCP